MDNAVTLFGKNQDAVAAKMRFATQMMAGLPLWRYRTCGCGFLPMISAAPDSRKVQIPGIKKRPASS